MSYCYSTEYLKEHEIFKETYTDKKERDSKARILRKEGWTVKCEKWDFSDLARATAYSIHAERRKNA